ncbi:MAG: DUF4236 domain-containing protein [Balneolaceae bacterium]|nr:MAG: DUF4236 domain-containing protein [Balneolaceae bacterium]
MGFYIRKAFKTGPVRLNLSKGGLGLSAGITGARIGLNTRGIYVHGGRHGLYYRKYLKKGTQRDSGRTQGSAPGSGTVYLFRDTGATFSPMKPIEMASDNPVFTLPSTNLFTAGALITPLFLLFLALLSLSKGLQWLFVPALIASLMWLSWFVYQIYWRNRVQKLLSDAEISVKESGTLPDMLSMYKKKIPERWNLWLRFHLHAVIGEMAIREETIDTQSILHSLETDYPIPGNSLASIRVSILNAILEEMLTDHLLSEQEELALKGLLKSMNLPKPEKLSITEKIDFYSQIRNEMEKPLEKTDPDIPLLRGESAYEQFEQVRRLKEKVLNRFQRDHVQYREIGYEIESEGSLILTDRRILLIGRGTDEYRFNRLADITTDHEAGILELTFTNRKTPVILSSPQPLLLAARLEKILDILRAC